MFIKKILEKYKGGNIFIKCVSGFSLIELLIAMLIFSIIIMSFTPLLLESIKRLHYAGSKSEALYHGQSDMEFRIVERETFEGEELVFTFGNNELPDTVITVPGGVIEVEPTVNEASAWLSGFVPFVPTINLHLDPLPLVEGYDPLDIIVLGKDTELVDGHKIVIKDNSESIVSSGFHSNLKLFSYNNNDTIPSGYDQYGEFRLEKGLNNALSPYLAEMEWTIADSINVKVSARFQIEIPYAVVVGSGQRIIVSPDARGIWNIRNSDFNEGLGTINDVVWTEIDYVAVTDNGSVIIMGNRKPIEVLTNVAGISQNLNAIVYGSGRLVAVGGGGTIVTTQNRTTWIEQNVNIDENTTLNATLNAIAFNDTENKFVAVGDKGTIISSSDGVNWNYEELYESVESKLELIEGDKGNITFYGVAHGNNTWIVVGKQDISPIVFSYSDSNSKWVKNRLIDDDDDETLYAGEETIYDIAYNSVSFLAVGSGGLVVTLTNNGTTTVCQEDTSINTSDDLYSVIWDNIQRGDESEGRYIITGSNGKILVGNEGSWTPPYTVSGTLKGVAVR